MTVPVINKFHRPILEALDVAQGDMSYKAIIEELRARLFLTDEDFRETIPSGRSKIHSRTYNAAHSLKQAGLVVQPDSSGNLQITEKGRQYLLDCPGLITGADLKELAVLSREDRENVTSPPLLEDVSVEEQLDIIVQQLREQLADDILTNLKDMDDRAFERLVTQLLSKMGYGEIERAHGHKGDGGIDGILTQDELGLEKVYVQAKRWIPRNVGGPNVNEFSGSLGTHGATKGVLVTTSSFTPPAYQAAAAAAKDGKTVRLINGQELAQLMIRYGVGVATNTYEVKKLDANYFADV